MFNKFWRRYFFLKQQSSSSLIFPSRAMCKYENYTTLKNYHNIFNTTLKCKAIFLINLQIIKHIKKKNNNLGNNIYIYIYIYI
jgi:hypothetical protein